MRLLAVDPGYDRCGVAIVEQDDSPRITFSTCIVTNKKASHSDRLLHVYDQLEGFIKQWNPSTMALETLFFSVNKKTAIKVAEARGVVLLLAAKKQLPVLEISPQAVKLSMTGVGNASKEQVQKMVGLSLKINIQDKIDDELDAIALGVTALQTLRLHTKIKNGL